MNLLTILAEFRNADAQSIEWIEGNKEYYGCVRFQVHNKSEHYEVTLIDHGNGKVEIYRQNL